MEVYRSAKCSDSKHTYRLARQSYTLLAYIKRQLNNLHPLQFLKIATTNAQVAIANLSPTLIYKKRRVHWKKVEVNITVWRRFFFYFFHWHYSPLSALACRTMSFHFFLSATNSLHLLTPITWRSLSASSFHFFSGSSSSRPFQFLSEDLFGILSSSILSRWHNQLIHCPFIHFTIFSPFLISSSSLFVRLFHPRFHIYDHIFF